MLAVTDPDTLRKLVGHTELILYDLMLNPVKYCANAALQVNIMSMLISILFIFFVSLNYSV